MADNIVLLREFERICRCNHKWKFQMEKDAHKIYWCPKCNAIKKELVQETTN